MNILIIFSGFILNCAYGFTLRKSVFANKVFPGGLFNVPTDVGKLATLTTVSIF